MPIRYRPYLSKEWAEEVKRREKTEVPEEVELQTKPDIALPAHRSSVHWARRVANHRLPRTASTRSLYVAYHVPKNAAGFVRIFVLSCAASSARRNARPRAHVQRRAPSPSKMKYPRRPPLSPRHDSQPSGSSDEKVRAAAARFTKFATLGATEWFSNHA
jgi:hypothetical protein